MRPWLLNHGMLGIGTVPASGESCFNEAVASQPRNVVESRADRVQLKELQ